MRTGSAFVKELQTQRDTAQLLGEVIHKASSVSETQYLSIRALKFGALGRRHPHLVESVHKCASSALWAMYFILDATPDEAVHRALMQMSRSVQATDFAVIRDDEDLRRGLAVNLRQLSRELDLARIATELLQEKVSAVNARLYREVDSLNEEIRKEVAAKKKKTAETLKYDVGGGATAALAFAGVTKAFLEGLNMSGLMYTAGSLACGAASKMCFDQATVASTVRNDISLSISTLERLQKVLETDFFRATSQIEEILQSLAFLWTSLQSTCERLLAEQEVTLSRRIAELKVFVRQAKEISQEVGRLIQKSKSDFLSLCMLSREE